MKTFLFYTTEGETIAPDGSEVENCQVLAFVDARNAAEARCKFCEQEQWAMESGYCEILVREVAKCAQEVCL